MIKLYRKIKKWLTGQQTKSATVQDYRLFYLLLITIAVGVWSDILVTLVK